MFLNERHSKEYILLHIFKYITRCHFKANFSFGLHVQKGQGYVFCRNFYFCLFGSSSRPRNSCYLEASVKMNTHKETFNNKYLCFKYNIILTVTYIYIYFFTVNYCFMIVFNKNTFLKKLCLNDR